MVRKRQRAGYVEGEVYDTPEVVEARGRRLQELHVHRPNGYNKLVDSVQQVNVVLGTQCIKPGNMYSSRMMGKPAAVSRKISKLIPELFIRSATSHIDVALFCVALRPFYGERVGVST